MNLLMISGDRSILKGTRGAFWYTLEEFSRQWERIDVITPHVKGAAETPRLFDNVYLHPNPRPGLWRQQDWIHRRGVQLHALFRHDVMTVHEYPPFYNGRGAATLAKVTGMPYALEIHHIVGYPTPATLQERIGYFLSRLYLPRAAKKATAIRTVSKHSAETLLSWGLPKRKVHVVPSFYLDHDVFSAFEQPIHKQYDIVFCGRLVPNKHLPALIRAVATLPRATLVVVGDGPERAACEKLTRQLDIAHRVEFRGWLPTQQDVLQAIAHARVFVMNSLSEGGPRVALEAMALGMPCVVTPVGVMPDIVIDGTNAMLTTGAPEDMAEKIDMLLQDPAMRTAIGEAAKGVLDRFERTTLLAQYGRFLRGLV